MLQISINENAYTLHLRVCVLSANPFFHWMCALHTCTHTHNLNDVHLRKVGIYILIGNVGISKRCRQQYYIVCSFMLLYMSTKAHIGESRVNRSDVLFFRYCVRTEQVFYIVAISRFFTIPGKKIVLIKVLLTFHWNRQLFRTTFSLLRCVSIIGTKLKSKHKILENR